jgi:acyl-CoA thioesterase-1
MIAFIWDPISQMKPLTHYILASFILLVAWTGNAMAGTKNCDGKTLVVLGDSLVAGFGLDPGAAYPEQLAAKLSEKGIRVEVINAGVSGDTTSSGLARLEWSVGEEADAVLLELGANDALRGISPEVTEKNLDAMIEKLKARNIEVLLAGMMAPPNMGKSYGKQFNGIYKRLAEKHAVSLYPFFLEGVVADPKLNLPDGIHPTREGIAVIVEKTLPAVKELLKKTCQ